MAAGKSARTQAQTMEPSAALRMAKLRALKSRSSLPFTPISPNEENDLVRQDPSATLRAHKTTAERMMRPQNSLPALETTATNLRNDGDANDNETAGALEDEARDIAEEAMQTEDISRLSRLRARAQAARNAGTQKLEEKIQKEIMETTQKAIKEGAAKFASAADEGEALLIADTAGTGFSALNLGLSIFQDSIDPKFRNQLALHGLGTLKPTNALDIFITMGTNMQLFKWSALICVVIPFCVIFIVLTYGHICQSNIVCNNLGTDASALISKISSFF
jgi:hypothetical protein